MPFATDYGYKLTTDGDQLFLDVVEYMITGTVTSTSAQERLIWVTENLPADGLYIAEIEAMGYEVITADLQVSVVSADSAAIMDSLASTTVVVISRNTNSTNYANKAFWNNVPTPVLTLSSFLVRNNRWGMSADPSTSVSSDGDVIKVVGDTSSTLFAFITVTDSLLDMLTAGSIEVAEFGDSLGIGNGTLYATSSTLGRVAVAEWPANTPFYTDSPDSAVDKRMLLALTGF